MKNLFRKVFKLPLLEKLLLKLNSGKEYGSLLTKLTPNHTDYPKDTKREVERDNLKYILDISDIVDWYIYFDFKETSRTRLLSLVQESSTIMDIGANIGQVAMQFARKASNGSVYAFEPFPDTYKRLENHLRLNKLENLHIYNVGIGNTTGELLFQTSFSGNPGMNRVTNDETLATTKISTICLDHFVENQHIQKIDLMKIDVEGYEFEVLKGAKNTIEKFHPKLFIELDDENLKLNNASAAELVSWLMENNYTIRHAQTNEKITQSSNFNTCHFDIIAE